MAAPQQISFGLGSPASLKWLLTFGLDAAAAAPIGDSILGATAAISARAYSAAVSSTTKSAAVTVNSKTASVS